MYFVKCIGQVKIEARLKRKRNQLRTRRRDDFVLLFLTTSMLWDMCACMCVLVSECPSECSIPQP